MPKWNFSRLLPEREKIKNHSNLRWLAKLLRHDYLWQLNRHTLAGGVAVGLFAAFIPLPIQMALAALLAIIFRANLPIAILMTWVSNPVTLIPMVLLIYKTGEWLTQSQSHQIVIQPFIWNNGNWHDSLLSFCTWFSSLGKTFLIGLPLPL